MEELFCPMFQMDSLHSTACHYDTPIMVLHNFLNLNEAVAVGRRGESLRNVNFG